MLGLRTGRKKSNTPVFRITQGRGTGEKRGVGGVSELRGDPLGRREVLPKSPDTLSGQEGGEGLDKRGVRPEGEIRNKEGRD